MVRVSPHYGNQLWRHYSSVRFRALLNEGFVAEYPFKNHLRKRVSFCSGNRCGDNTDFLCSFPCDLAANPSGLNLHIAQARKGCLSGAGAFP
jgi:hypothetical protein